MLEKRSRLCVLKVVGVWYLTFGVFFLPFVKIKNKRRYLLSASEKRADSVVSAVLVLSPKPVTTNTIDSVVKVHK